MTTEEKLQHFYEVSVESAKAEAAQEIENYKKALAKLFEEHKQEKIRQSQLELKAETDNAKRQINKALSVEQLNIKRRLAKKQLELRDSIISEVKNRLEEFMGTPDYTKYLCKKIKEALDFADGDEMTIYISSNDASLLPTLVAQTNQQIEISSESFFGGLKAVIPSKNIIIDNTFSALVESEKAEFTFDGGLSYE